MFRFVRWIMAFSGADFALEMADNAVTGRVLGTTALANYRMGYQMAMEGPALVRWVVLNVAFPSISRIQSSPVLVRKNALGIVASMAATMVPATTLLGALAPRLVDILLGPKWQPAVLPLRLLAVAALARSLCDVAPPILRGVGKTRADFLLRLFQVVLMCSLLVPLGRRWGLTGIALAVDIAAVVAVPVVYVALARALDMTLPAIVRAVAPQFAAAAAASVAFVLHGTFWLDVCAGLVFCAIYVGVSWAFLRALPFAGIATIRDLGAESA
jgi:PST family polysaccharide transporter